MSRIFEALYVFSPNSKSSRKFQIAQRQDVPICPRSQARARKHKSSQLPNPITSFGVGCANDVRVEEVQLLFVPIGVDIIHTSTIIVPKPIPLESTSIICNNKPSSISEAKLKFYSFKVNSRSYKERLQEFVSFRLLQPISSIIGINKHLQLCSINFHHTINKRSELSTCIILHNDIVHSTIKIFHLDMFTSTRPRDIVTNYCREET